MSNIIDIFDRKLVQTHRERAAKKISENNFLFSETAHRLHDKLDDINKSFSFGLDLGCHSGEMRLMETQKHSDISWVRTDLSLQMAKTTAQNSHSPVVVMDEEYVSFKDKTFDLVVSNLSLHWVNDLPGTLAQIFRILKPDGLFLASLLGEQTLTELNYALSQAEIEHENGLSPRISPFAGIKDIGNLLVRAGFALSVADTEKITVFYPNALHLMRDIRAMGESNSNKLRRKTFSRRATIMRATEIYHENFKNTKNEVPATFDIVSLTGWAPHKIQQKALKPGSGKTSLKDFFSSSENS